MGTRELIVIVFCAAFLIVPPIFILALVMALVKKTRGWIIATVVSGIVGLLLVIGGIVAAVGMGISAAKKQALPQDFSTASGVATVTGASGWSVLDIGSEDADLGIGNIYSEQYLIVLAEPKTDFPEGYDLAAFAELAYGQFSQTLADVEAGEPVEVSYQSIPRLRRELRAASDGIRIFYLIDYAEGRDHYYQVMSWTLEDRESKGKPVLEAALNSFRENAGLTPE